MMKDRAKDNKHASFMEIRKFTHLHPADIKEMLMALPSKKRSLTYLLLPTDSKANVFPYSDLVTQQELYQFTQRYGKGHSANATGIPRRLYCAPHDARIHLGKKIELWQLLGLPSGVSHHSLYGLDRTQPKRRTHHLFLR